MADQVAATNACGFIVEDIEVLDADYDPHTGTLMLKIAFQYSGEQDLDKPWCGDVFYIPEAVMHICWRDQTWKIADDDPFEIVQFDTDADRDFIQQSAQ